jgi:hypothetical protein
LARWLVASDGQSLENVGQFGSSETEAADLLLDVLGGGGRIGEKVRR